MEWLAGILCGGSVLIRNLGTQRFAGVNGALRAQDLGQIPKADDPAEEHGRDGNINVEGEVLAIRLGYEHGIRTETVNDHVDKILVEPQLYVDVFAGIHLEQLVGVFGEGFSG